MKQRTKEATRHIDVVLRTLDILDCFQDAPSLSIREIIEKTGLTRSRTMRLLGTLESRGYISEDPTTKRFVPGIRLAILGKAFETSHSLEIIIRPVLKYIADTTGESTEFYALAGHERVVLFREDGKNRFSYSGYEGQRIILHGGAGGKLLLAFGPKELLESILSSKQLPKLAPRTITDPKLLKKEIDSVRRKGYAFSRAETVAEAYGVAAPVFSHQNNLLGALGIVGNIDRLSEEKLKEQIKIVCDECKSINERFGNSI